MQVFKPSSEHMIIKDTILRAGDIALKWFRNDPENWEKEDGSLISKVDIEINNLLMKIYNDDVSKTDGVDVLKTKLKNINLSLWKIEDDIRDCERDKIFDNTFVELARSVYFTNDKRSKVKLEINLLLNSSLVEEKSYKDY